MMKSSTPYSFGKGCNPYEQIGAADVVSVWAILGQMEERISSQYLFKAMAASFNSNRNVEAGDIAILKENAWMQTRVPKVWKKDDGGLWKKLDADGRTEFGEKDGCLP